MVNVNDPIVRKAIWENYNKKCFYCNEPISKYSDLQIEHIIATAIPNKQLDKYEELKKELELPADFDLDDLINLVPSQNKCNRDKSDNILPTKTYHHYYSITRGKKNEIEAIIKKIREELKQFDKEMLADLVKLNEQNSEINNIKSFNVVEEIIDIWSKIPPSKNNILRYIVLERFNEILNKRSVSENQLPTIKRFLDLFPNIVLDINDTINLEIIDLLFPLTFAPEARKLIKKKILPEIRKFYNSGCEDLEILKILYICGDFGDVFNSLIKSVNKRNLHFFGFVSNQFFNLIYEPDEKKKIIANRKKIVKDLTLKRNELEAIENPSSEISTFIPKLNDIIRNILKLE